MNNKTRIALLAVAGIGSGLLLGSGIASWQWNRTTRQEIERVYSAPVVPPPQTFSVEQLKGLPAPVARYFRFALTPGQPLYDRGRVRQSGFFRVGGSDAPWSPFTATQAFAATPPGFVWDATIFRSPAAPVRVRDSYLEGNGATLARLGAVIPLADQHGTPERATAALQRWLAEAVWFPTMLLPGETISWVPIDENSALALVTDTAHGVLVSLEFTFGVRGEIVRCYTPARYRDNASYPWEGRYANYVSRSGMQVPLDSEVAWLLPEGRQPYCRLHLEESHYGL